MSFSNDVKNEIISNKPLRMRYKTAQAYGLFLYAKSFSQDEIALHTESSELAELYCWFIKEFVGKGAKISLQQKRQRGKQISEISVATQSERDKLLELFPAEQLTTPTPFQTPEQEQQFLTGAWLACGNITDPQKSYHMEFVCREEGLCSLLEGYLNRYTKGAHRTMRRGMHILYFKECAEIEDLLALLGATKCSLSMIEVEIIKNMRNDANRATNCETANIDKMVSASTSQIEDIQFIVERKGLDWLPENLRQIALLRMDNPDMSLRELAENSPFTISRSGIHHRLDKLSKLADSLREEREG